LGTTAPEAPPFSDRTSSPTKEIVSEQHHPDPSLAPDGPAAAGSPTQGPSAGAGTGPSPTGPESVLTCAACGKKNRIRPSERGVPHCGSCGTPLPWLVNATDATFDIEAKAAVTVLVDLWAPWCGPCRVVGPILEELARDFAGRLKVVKVNVDENPALAARFGAMSIPTLVVIRNGRVLDRIVGALPKSQLTIRLTPYLLRT
jgi:thioredoxin 2